MIAGTPPKPIAPVGRLPFAFAKRHGVLVRGVADGKAQVVYREGASPSAVAELRRFLGIPLVIERVAQPAFDDLLRGVVSEATLETASKYVKLLWGERANENLIKSINPLAEVEVTFDHGNAGRDTRYLEFDFHRVKQDGVVRQVLVSVTDVTSRVLLAREIKQSQDSADAQMDLLLAMLQVEPGRDTNAFAAVLPHVFGGGTAGDLVPYATLVTDFAHHLDQLRGNDALWGEAGDDTLVGDDQTVVARADAFDDASMARAEWITRSLLDVSDDLSDLVHRQYGLLDWPGHPHVDDQTVVVDQVLTIGADTLDGGDGNDVLIGDDNLLVETSLAVRAGLAGGLERFAEGMADAAHELAHVVQDTADLDRHLREEVVLVPHKRHVHETLVRHVDIVEMGNDTLLGGAGNDFIVGDSFTVRAAEVTVVPGGSPRASSFLARSISCALRLSARLRRPWITGTAARVSPDFITIDGWGATLSAGSPVIDEEGLVAGLITTAAPSAGGRLYDAVPVKFALELLDRLQ